MSAGCDFIWLVEARRHLDLKQYSSIGLIMFLSFTMTMTVSNSLGSELQGTKRCSFGQVWLWLMARAASNPLARLDSSLPR